MKTTELVLKYIEENKGRWFSGAALASELHLSRNAVWKAVGTLRERGYDIQSSSKRGYCLSDRSDKLSREGILPYLLTGCEYDPSLLHVYESVDSTNKEAFRLLLSGEGHGTVVASEMQTGGKGHGKKSFSSPPGGIYLSIILDPMKMHSPDPSAVTRSVADCFIDAAGTLCGRNIEFEKPSGCLLNGKKTAGILTEALYDADIGKAMWYVPGIGINYYTKSADFPPEIRDKAGSVFGDNDDVTVSRNQFIAELIKRLLQL